MIRRIIVTFISFIMFSVPINVFGADNVIKVFVDGVEVKFNQPPINENGRILVPVKPIAEAFKFTVLEYPDFPTTVTVMDERDRNIMGISSTIYWGKHSSGYVTTNFLNVKKERNVKLEPLPKNFNGVTYFGISNLSEIFGVDCTWVATTNSVLLKSSIDKNKSISNSINEKSSSEEKRREYELEVVKLINIERKKEGLTEVEIFDNLMLMARAKAEEMATLKYFSHKSPNYESITEMGKAFGMPSAWIAENIQSDIGSPVPKVSVKPSP